MPPGRWAPRNCPVGDSGYESSPPPSGSILGYAHGQYGKLTLVVALSLLDMGLNAQLSLSFKFLIDKAIGEKNEQALYWIVGALCVSIVVVTVGGLWRDHLYAAITSNLVAGLRQRLFAHLQKLSAGFYSRTPAGEIVSPFSTTWARSRERFSTACHGESSRSSMRPSPRCWCSGSTGGWLWSRCWRFRWR